MVLLALAPILTLGTPVSDVQDLAIAFLRRLESVHLVDGRPSEETGVSTFAIGSDGYIVRVTGCYTITVHLPTRQVTGCAIDADSLAASSAMAETWDEESFIRRVRLYHRVTGAPGEVARVENLKGLADPSAPAVEGYARLGFENRLFLQSHYFRFDRRTGLLLNCIGGAIPTPRPAGNLVRYDETIGAAGVAAFRLRDATGRQALWEVLSLMADPFGKEAVLALPVRMAGGEPLAERHLWLNRSRYAVPVYWIRFATVDPATGLVCEASPACEVLVDAEDGTVINAGVVSVGGGSPDARRAVAWRDATFRSVETAAGRRKITGPSLGPETPTKADDDEIACALVGDGLIVRAFYRPGTRTVRVGKLVLRAGQGLVAAMKAPAK